MRWVIQDWPPLLLRWWVAGRDVMLRRDSWDAHFCQETDVWEPPINV